MLLYLNFTDIRCESYFPNKLSLITLGPPMEPRRGGWAVLEERNLVAGANLVPRVFSLSNIKEREDPGDEEREELWVERLRTWRMISQGSTEEIGDFIS